MINLTAIYLLYVYVNRKLISYLKIKKFLFILGRFSVAAWPRGKAAVCKTAIPRFDSGRRLQN